MPSRDGGLDLWEAVLSRAAGSGTQPSILSLLRGASVRACTADEISIQLGASAGPEDVSAARHVVARSAEDFLGRRPLVDISPGEFAQRVANGSAFPGIPRPQLNENYRFENFVIGPSNRLAHAAALAVSDAPGQAYNPLFFHSASGMGKSHLLQAACRRILERRADTALVYISCDDFQNLFLSAVQAGELDTFRHRFRCSDVLVVDDIHFLANRERSQEEFFHTFNALYNSSRQIILSCDSAPREIPQLQERLLSRFKWGLVAEIELPSFETRLEIIRMKAASRSFALPTDVMEYIAEQSDASIRELEGAVLKIVGYASLLGAPVDLALAREVLHGPTTRGASGRSVSIEDILSTVAAYYSLTPSQIQARGRARSVSLPRQVCMHLARVLTAHSLEGIGSFFGGRDHSTVKHACDKIRKLVAAGGEFAGTVRSIKRQLTRGA